MSFLVIFVASAASLVLSEVSVRIAPSSGFYMLHTRAWELLVGSMAAFLMFGQERPPSNALSSAGLVMVGLAIFCFDQSVPVPSVYVLLPVIGTALILVYGTHGTWVAQILSFKGLVAIGLISYSAYLWHQPLLAFARLRAIHEPHPLLLLLLDFSSFVLAALTWRYVEMPFRRRSGPLFPRQRNVFVSGAFIATFLVAIAAYGHLSGGGIRSIRLK